MSETLPPRIFLIGFMGAGKTAVGRALARRIGYDFVDLDQRIERARGRSVAEIFADEGEAAFRTLEREALAALREERSLVVATGGGLFAAADNRALVAQLGVSVWLDVDLEVAWRRCARRPGRRPLATDREAFARLFSERRASYEQADARVAGEERAIAAVAAEVERRLRERATG